jgi:hypothetical protein
MQEGRNCQAGFFNPRKVIRLIQERWSLVQFTVYLRRARGHTLLRHDTLQRLAVELDQFNTTGVSSVQDCQSFILPHWLPAGDERHLRELRD